MVTRSVHPADQGVQGVHRVAGSRAVARERHLRYRLDVVAPTVLDAMTFAGGWIYDRAMAGWDVTVLIGAHEDVRPLEIFGAEVRDLETVLASWDERPHPQTVAVAADLLDTNARVHRHVLNALEQGATEVTLWGERLPSELGDSVDSVEHHLSTAARVFKAQALAALSNPQAAAVEHTETFRCGVVASGAADPIPAEPVGVSNSP
jgi:hypothetical protein